METRTCPRCGRQIAADQPRGLCAACLLEKGMKSVANLRCSVCASELADDTRFCGQCGAPVPQPAAVEGDPLRKALETKLKGHYRLVRLLGRGGMGAVYLARDLTLDREVAIKVVNTVADSPELKDRFRREARTAAKLSHANIVPLYSFGEVEGMPYFVMGYVRGESLGARLRRDGKLEEVEARRILADIADALDHAHRQGVIHRDVKPDNVLLEDDSGRALLTDFGVAKAIGHGETLTRFASAIGTPHFMSPEQASGEASVDGRSDLYSLGVMGFAMLAGRLPFEGTTADVLTKHLTQTPPRLGALAPNVSDSTAQAVERCMAKDPAKRWPDARALKLALGEGDDSRLPEDLQVVEGHAVILFLILLGFHSLTLGDLYFSGRVMDNLFILAVTTGFMVIAHLFIVIRLRMEGYSFAQSERASWTEPPWWPAWFPRRLRRPGNVWDRLPSSVRAMRSWYALLALFAYTMPFLIAMGRFEVTATGPLFRGMLDIVVGVVVLGSSWVFLELRARKDLAGRGLSNADVHRVALAASLSRVSFWSRPHIAALLLPAESADTRAGSPSDQLQSIVRNANELSGPLRPLGAQAAAAARQLVEAIGDADREIAELTRSIEPGEKERLTNKIAALTHEEQAPLRSLLEKQLELIRDLSARVDEAQQRRDRRVETLKTLALHVTTLRSRVTVAPSEVRLVSENVRALCEEIARQVTALSTDAPTIERR